MPAQPRTSLKEYAFALAAVGLSTALCFAVYPFLAPANLVMLYLLATLVVASRGLRGPAAFSSLLSVASFDFFFVPPRFTLTVTDSQYVVTFAVMFITAMVISHLTLRLRSEAEAAREGERRTVLMHAFTQQLAGAPGRDGVLRIAVRHLADTFNASVTAFTPGREGRVEMRAQSSDEAPSEKMTGIAQWVFDQTQPAGLGTTSLPMDDALSLPLIGTGGTVGVITVRPRVPGSLDTREQRLLLDSFAHQIALAMDVDRLQESAREAEVEAETERLRSSLLSSVSHDLRTPLTAIVGSASALLARDDVRGNPSARELSETIQSEGERLSRLVQNLLEATRLESGAARLNKELYPMEDVLGSALDRLEKSLEGRAVKIDVAENIPPVPMDGLLIEQVIINLLENALRHTPPQTPVEIAAKADGAAVVITVADEGPGLKPDELERVFEKFTHQPSSPGAGLGLAICRAIVKAHGGRIWAENRPGRGAAFHFTLPLNSPA